MEVRRLMKFMNAHMTTTPAWEEKTIHVAKGLIIASMCVEGVWTGKSAS